MKPAIIEPAIEQYAIEVREAYSALREAEVQEAKSEERSVKAQRIAAGDRDATEHRRVELGKALLRARSAWPERGPKAKGWGEFLEREGLSQSTAYRYMEAAGGTTGEKISVTGGRLNEIPHPAEGKDEASPQPEPPKKPFGKLLDMDLFLGRWEDVLSDVGRVNTIITDPPYSERVHKSAPTRDDDSDPDGLTPNYEPWSPKDVEAFIEHWSPLCRGWMVMLCDDELIPAYRRAYERMDRIAFAPVPCVITGMSVRTRGDGPSSWAVYAMVARPAGAEFVRWGTLPGAYVGNKVGGAKHGRGKPPWLTDAFARDYSREGDLICDPLAGYGGTLVSALTQRRRALGAEQDEKAVEEAFIRVNARELPGGEAAQPTTETA